MKKPEDGDIKPTKEKSEAYVLENWELIGDDDETQQNPLKMTWKC
ncbi:MAG: hypothetical protein CM15mL5_2170 [uncultured marine virus]|nr:MAG: hypothetical protein CM15mL5_2170 [uncultured marine virus]